MANIKINDLDVIDSGSIVSPNSGKIQVELEGPQTFTVEMEMTFSEEDKESRIEAFEIEPVGVGIRLLNHVSSLGTGNTEPIRIGWYQGRSLFINYRLFPINDKQGGIFHFTFLLGKKVDDHGNEV